MFIAVGYGGTILVSSDAITWTPKQAGYVNDLMSVTNSDNQIVAVGEGGTILTSAIRPLAIQNNQMHLPAASSFNLTIASTSHRQLAFSYHLSKSSNVNFRIYNLSGKIVCSLFKTSPAGTQLMHVPLVKVSAGPYFLEITAGTLKEHRIFIIQ
jgi:hypothetical protein